MKACDKCQTEKSLSNYFNDKRYSGGYCPTCKECAGGIKKCNECEVEKPLAQFDNEPRNTGPKGKGVASKCKECCRALEAAWKEECCRALEAAWKEENPERVKQYYQDNRDDFQDYHLHHRYGITMAEYEERLAKQDGKCAICRTTEPRGNGRFRVDHAHVEGFAKMPPEEKRKHLRSLLCHHCNVALGSFKDDPTLLRAAADYIESYQNRDESL